MDIEWCSDAEWCSEPEWCSDSEGSIVTLSDIMMLGDVVILCSGCAVMLSAVQRFSNGRSRVVFTSKNIVSLL